MPRRSLGIPELGGIGSYSEAARPGLSVERNVALNRRYAWVEKRLMEIAINHICPVPEWEVKCALSLHCWIDAEHATGFRQRVAEMREPPLHLDVVPDQRLDALLEEALRAADTVELLVGLYRVVKPALAVAYERHLAETNVLADHPTVRLLKIAIAEEREHIAWGEAAIAALTKTPEAVGRAGAWERHLVAYLRAAGGVWGDGDTGGVELPPARATKPFEPDLVPRRDERFELSFQSGLAELVYKDESKPAHERTMALMYKRLREMDVPEMMAGIIVRTPDKPWEYYRELARQLWDEARHSMMGEAAFEAVGVDWTAVQMSISFSYMLNKMSPLDAHARLYDIERGLMTQSGKRYEWEIALRSGMPVATTFQDYDWADEVLHAQIGRRQFVAQFPDRPTSDEYIAGMKERAEELRRSDPNLGQPEPDWWTPFYAQMRPPPGAPGSEPIPEGEIKLKKPPPASARRAAELLPTSG
jgi:hypothetical protein